MWHTQIIPKLIFFLPGSAWPSLSCTSPTLELYHAIVSLQGRRFLADIVKMPHGVAPPAEEANIMFGIAVQEHLDFSEPCKRSGFNVSRTFYAIQHQ